MTKQTTIFSHITCHDNYIKICYTKIMEIRFCENDTCKKPIPQFNKNGTKITEKVYKKRRFS